MAAYNMYTSAVEISKEDYDFVSKDKDGITVMEGDRTDVRKVIMKKLNERLRCIGDSWQIVEVKYVANLLNAKKYPRKNTYLTKEISESGDRYRRYDLEDPFDMCGADLVQGMSEQDLFKPIPLPSRRDLAIKACVRKYVGGLYPFDKCSQRHVRIAQNEASTNSSIELKEGLQYTAMCGRMFDHEDGYSGYLPFCEFCGVKERLWRFGPAKSRVCCETCFQEKFTDLPRGRNPDDNSPKSWKEFLDEYRDVPYLDYEIYMNRKSRGIEYVIFNEANYRRGRMLLASPKLKEISRTLTKKQNHGLYEMAFFLRSTALRKDNIDPFEVPCSTGLAFLLTEGRE